MGVIIQCPLCDGFIDTDSMICNHAEPVQHNQCTDYYGHCKKHKQHKDDHGGQLPEVHFYLGEAPLF